MAGAGNKQPIIIKRKKGGGGEGHHGGAWKVAYADFVTAMMAFFLMMWLLNATTVEQKKGLADYFDSRIPVARVSGGGRGAFGGDSLTEADRQPHTATGSVIVNDGRAVTLGDKSDDPDGAVSEAENDQTGHFEDIESAIASLAGTGPLADEILQHLRTRMTREGLVIDIYETEDAPLFDPDTGAPTPLMQSITAMMAGLASIVTNDISVAGHTAADSTGPGETDATWALSAARAEQTRQMLVRAGLDPARINHITSHAATEPMVEDPHDVRNHRVAITLMRNPVGR